MNWLANLLVLGLIVVVASFGYYRSDAQIGAVADETHTALCAFKHDLEERRSRLWEFRESGREIPGITSGDINRSLSQQKQTLDALSALSC